MSLSLHPHPLHRAGGQDCGEDAQLFHRNLSLLLPPSRPLHAMMSIIIPYHTIISQPRIHTQTHTHHTHTPHTLTPYPRSYADTGAQVASAETGFGGLTVASGILGHELCVKRGKGTGIGGAGMAEETVSERELGGTGVESCASGIGGTGVESCASGIGGTRVESCTSGSCDTGSLSRQTFQGGKTVKIHLPIYFCQVCHFQLHMMHCPLVQRLVHCPLVQLLMQLH